MDATLAIDEKRELLHLEAMIHLGMRSFCEVGKALLQIRDRRLYRESHKTFEDYCRERWGMTRMRASQLISAAAVSENVNHGLQSERQARPLARLEPEQQKEVWEEAVETAPNGKVTAAHVEEIVKGRSGRNDDPDSDSNVLFTLKRYWKRASKKDRRLFLKWIEEKEG